MIFFHSIIHEYLYYHIDANKWMNKEKSFWPGGMLQKHVVFTHYRTTLLHNQSTNGTHPHADVVRTDSN